MRFVNLLVKLPRELSLRDAIFVVMEASIQRKYQTARVARKMKQFLLALFIDAIHVYNLENSDYCIDSGIERRMNKDAEVRRLSVA